MDDEVRDEIGVLVRAGFYTRERLVEIICEEMYSPGELERADVENAVDEAWSALVAEQKSWPAETDCDRLDRVFTSLNAAGVIALQNAGITQSDGYEDVRERYDHLRAGSGDASNIMGYCFYHGQDLNHAVQGGHLYLAFGPMDPRQEETEGPRVGQHIVATLTKEGFNVEWNGEFSTRILVTGMKWMKRIS
jgi:hypothetical protein